MTSEMHGLINPCIFCMFTQILKRKSTWAIVVILLVVGIYTAFGRSAKPPVFVMGTVESGTLVQTVEATGTLTSTHEIRLGFETSGIVVAVPKIGDVVKPGQLLARLAGTELFAGADQARRAVQVSEASVASAQSAVANAHIEVANATRDLARSGEKSTQSVESAQQDLAAALPSAMIADRKAISDADEVLGIDNMLTNDTFENVLSALDSSALLAARNAYVVAKASRAAAESPVFALSTSASDVQVQALVPVVERALTDTSELLLHVSRALDATAVDTGDFSLADLSALKLKINNARTSIQSQSDNILIKRQSVANASIGSGTSSDSAQSAIDAANAALRNAQSVVNVRQAELLQTKASLAAANARAANTLIRSSIAGIVTAVDVDSGEAVSPGSPVITVQTVGDQFEIKLNIPESDISKVSVGESVATTFDAFGDRVNFQGKVVSVNPAQKNIEGVVYYETKIILEPVTGSDLKPGLTADSIITTQRLENTLFIPQRAVLQKDGESVVRVKTSETTYDERIVKTGVRGDEGRVQILDGLTAGEEIVISVKS